jgi:hypothetical protein
VKTTSFILSLLALTSPLRSADRTIASSSLTRGTLTFASDAIVFKTAKQYETFFFSPPPARFYDGLTIPGLRVLDFEHKKKARGAGRGSNLASLITFQCEDGSKLALTVNQPVEVLRVELTFSDRTKAILWKLPSDIR